MSTITAITMPKWGMTMDEGTLTEWLVPEGGQVQEGTVIATVESSKISGELEADHTGVLARHVLELGSTAPVGALVAVIAPESTPDTDIEAFISERSTQESTRHEPAQEKPATDNTAGSPTTGEESTQPATTLSQTLQPIIPQELRGFAKAPATVHALDLAREHDINLTAITATGRDGRVTVADIEAATDGRVSLTNSAPRVEMLQAVGDDSAIPATEHARDWARELGVNLLDATPTGRAGRVTVADVKATHARHNKTATRAVDTAMATGNASETTSSALDNNTSMDIPMSSMRKVIAKRLKESYLSSPHFRVGTEARIDGLLGFREEINANRRDLKVSVNDLMIAATARALVAVPELNAQFDESKGIVRQFEHADISVAVATEEGLITPIVTHADTRTLSSISTTMVDLSTRAKAGQLKPDEFQGGTFSISNLGMFDVASFDAIINPPQVAILAVSAAQARVVPSETGQPEVATIVPLTVSADHRVVDGATSARFVTELKHLLEHPALLFT